MGFLPDWPRHTTARQAALAHLDRQLAPRNRIVSILRLGGGPAITGIQSQHETRAKRIGLVYFYRGRVRAPCRCGAGPRRPIFSLPQWLPYAHTL